MAGDDTALDADEVARTLAALVKAESPDLVVLGKQAVDGDSNQVGQLLAGYLGWPQATFLASVMLAADGKSATVTREVDAGVEEKRVPLPAVLTVDLRIIGKKAVRNAALAPAEAEWEESQRYASLKGIMAAKKKEIKEITAESLGVDGRPARQDHRPRRARGAQGGSEGGLGRGAGGQAHEPKRRCSDGRASRSSWRVAPRGCSPARCRR